MFCSANASAITFKGKFIQGHFIIGKTEPDTKILIGKKEVKVSKNCYFVFGIDRDRKFDVLITKILNGNKEKIIKKVFKRKYNIQRIDGLEESKVTPPEEVYKRIKDENYRIGEARAINSNLIFFKTSSGRGLSEVNGPPGALCIKKKEIIISNKIVGIATLNLLRIYLNIIL